MKDETELLAGLDFRERVLVRCLFLVQLSHPKGLTFGQLIKIPSVSVKMSRRTYSHRLKELVNKGLLEKEVIMNRRGKPTLYRLNSRLFAGLREERERFYPWKLTAQIESFKKDTASFETSSYVEAMMELAFGLVSMLSIALTAYTESEIVRWLFYEATYENMEQVLRSIVNRASRSKEDKEETLVKLFEMLKPLASRSIGKRFGLEGVYSSEQDIINAAIEKTIT